MTIAVATKVVAMATPLSGRHWSPLAIHSRPNRANINPRAPMTDFIQTRPHITEAHSAAALFTTAGRIFGVNTANPVNRDGGSVGIGFSVPPICAAIVCRACPTTARSSRGLAWRQIRRIRQEVQTGFGSMTPRRGAVMRAHSR